MKSRVLMAAALVAGLMVFASAGSASAFTLLGGGCGCEVGPSCCEPARCCKPKRCWKLFNRCCKPKCCEAASCCDAAPACGCEAPVAPACGCEVAPACGCEVDCCPRVKRHCCLLVDARQSTRCFARCSSYAVYALGSKPRAAAFLDRRIRRAPPCQAATSSARSLPRHARRGYPRSRGGRYTSCVDCVALTTSDALLRRPNRRFRRRVPPGASAPIPRADRSGPRCFRGSPLSRRSPARW